MYGRDEAEWLAKDVVDKVVEVLQKASGVVVLSGAGMSTAAGIPDFRSPGGLYGSSSMLLDKFTYLGSDEEKSRQRAELERDVKGALTMKFFQRNPVAYHEMRRGLIVGLGENQWKYTLGHLFPEILSRNGKLQLLASQNIDGLDHKVITDPSKLYNPHGLMSVLVSEGTSEPLAVGVHAPVYQKYVELVKDNIKDIYAGRSARQGRSCHKWPPRCGDESKPITLEMFGDILPERFHAERGKEVQAAQQGQLKFSVKPGSVLFDRMLWKSKADGSKCDWENEAQSCDMMMIMGTSLSGLTIDNMAHIAARAGKPMVVFDMGRAPIDSIGRAWQEDKHFFMQGRIDESVLRVCHKMGWLEQLLEDTYLPHLCLSSLNIMKSFSDENPFDDESTAKLNASIELEIERERQLYGDSSSLL